MEPKLVLFSGQVDSACGYAGVVLGPVLLPRGRQGLHRPLVLRGDAAPAQRAGRLRPGLRHRPRGRPPRPEPARHQRPGHGPAGPHEREGFQPASWSAWSCRPTSWPGSGPTTPSLEPGFLESGDVEEGMNAASAVGDDRIMKQHAGLPSSPTPSPTARRSSASAGSRRASRPGDINQGDTFGAVVL
ncbi:MAG: neutral zinc metallopeptidase [Ignavibacteriales bacterium]|nr:neutral zinc metallopeptidase [Ignavibacteriales bacterium]